MASSDVDQKYLSRLAELTAPASPLISSSLYQILGLSVMLSRRLVRARTLRRLDTTRDTKSLQLYHHIIWLSREGLAILETFVLPYTKDGKHGRELQIMAAKLQASFFHVFCLFHNNPPVSSTSANSTMIPSAPVQLSPQPGHSPARRDSILKPADPRSRAKRSSLKDRSSSYNPETLSTPNPISPASPSRSRRSPAVPPGLTPVRPAASSSSFIFPTQNFLPATATYFDRTTALALQYLPGSHPMRLSVAIEHAAFLWDCMKDGDGSRALARRAIRDCHRSNADLSDADFEDAAECVGVLGRMMKREGLRHSPGAARTRNSAGSISSGLSPKEARAETSARRSYAEPSSSPALRGGYAQSTTSPTSTRGSTGRARGRGMASDDSSSIQLSPARSRASRRQASGGEAAAYNQSGSSGSTVKPTQATQQSNRTSKGSIGSNLSISPDSKRNSDGSKETTPTTARSNVAGAISTLRGSGVTRGGPTVRSRVGTSARGARG